jgi:hypothetical protein
MARDYDVDGTSRNQQCDLCKEGNTAAAASRTSKAVDENCCSSTA